METRDCICQYIPQIVLVSKNLLSCNYYFCAVQSFMIFYLWLSLHYASTEVYSLTFDQTEEVFNENDRNIE